MNIARCGFATFLISAVLAVSGCGSDTSDEAGSASSDSADAKPPVSEKASPSASKSPEEEPTYSGETLTQCLEQETVGELVGFEVALVNTEQGGALTCQYLSLQQKRIVQVLAANAQSLDEAQTTYDNMVSNAQTQIPKLSEAGIGAQSALFSESARLVLVARDDGGTLLNIVLNAGKASQYQDGLTEMGQALLDEY